MLQPKLERQQFANGYVLVNGVQMHAEMGERFQIPNHLVKKYVGIGNFVEVRIDSPRFSAHPDAPVNCTCPNCNEPATKPILCHEHPASLLNIPRAKTASRGWGEQFWVRIEERANHFFRGVIDNPLHESRLHGLNEGDEIVFHEDHVLAIHGVHNQEILHKMNADDFQEFGRWVQSQQKPE